MVTRSQPNCQLPAQVERDDVITLKTQREYLGENTGTLEKIIVELSYLVLPFKKETILHGTEWYDFQF